MILDMAAVFPQMRGDTVRAGGFAKQRSGYRVRFAETAIAVARFPYRGYMVNVDAQFKHGWIANWINDSVD